MVSTKNPTNPTPATGAPIDGFVDQDAVMRFLSCSRATLFRLRRRRFNPIPSVSWGGFPRFDLREVADWLRASRSEKPRRMRRTASSQRAQS